MTSSASALFAAACVILLSSLACGSTPTEPTPQPVYEQKTETFTGVLTTGGATAFHFAVTNPGDIVVAITQLGPTSTLTMGLSMGFWDNATSVCSRELTTNAATLNAAFSGNPSAAGEYCVTILDIGNVQTSTDFTLTITHY